MILAFDTYYLDRKARTIGIEFKNWTDSEVYNIYSETIDGINEYISGEFYKRELPCLLSILKKINLSNCEVIVIDGFVVLDDDNRKGLGAYLYEKLNNQIPIIGVAKNDFSSISKNKKKVLRGKSKKPLYITSIGIDLDVSSELIKNMYGKYRIPDLLKEVDSLGRQ